MTLDEQVKMLQFRVRPETVTEEEAKMILEISKGIILNRRYPFGFDEGTVVEPKYHTLQVDIAVELFNKSGAEGEVVHNENGINRTYQSAYVSNDLLKRITPLASTIAFTQ